MRHQFVQVKSLSDARQACPWACVCFRVEGGFMCFECALEAVKWGRQE